MKLFSQLISNLSKTTSLNEKIDALVDYFRHADHPSAAWCVFFLSGQKIKSSVKTKELRQWAMAEADIPAWLFEDSYAVVGDLAETIATLVAGANLGSDIPFTLADFVEGQLVAFKKMSEADRREAITTLWKKMDRDECFVFNKLMTGSFRVGASVKLVHKALARLANVDEAIIAHRLAGHWEPSAANFADLINENTADAVLTSKPYPFYLAYALDGDVSQLGEIEDWQVEWKWDGIRGQLIKRHGEVYLWSRGEELINDQFPEIIAAAKELLPDGVVLDGEILAYKNGAPLSFANLQQRLGRKRVGKDLLDQVPAAFMLYDLLEYQHVDLRDVALKVRRQQLEQIASSLSVARFPLSPLVSFRDWDELARIRLQSRDQCAEGFMIKQKDSVYQSGRRRGDWWKWKIDPMTLDLVLLYAQAGHGRRSNLYTDYTFGIWSEDTLVPLTKAYSGLTDSEIYEVDRWIKSHTLERFGPVRKVPAELVFEVAFEGIAPSNRHRSGLALRFPRILRWRKDKIIADADRLETARGLLH